MVDERAQQEAFETSCGGPTRAFYLLRIWESCPKSSNLLWPNPKDAPSRYGIKGRIEIFRDKAKKAGYSSSSSDLFLAIQGC